MQHGKSNSHVSGRTWCAAYATVEEVHVFVFSESLLVEPKVLGLESHIMQESDWPCGYEAGS